jgi:odd-skipped-like protein
MEESPHKCPVCARSFNQRSNLKTHLLTHTDHKPYECTSCGKVFRRNCDLRRHALTHAVGDVPPEALEEALRDDDSPEEDCSSETGTGSGSQIQGPPSTSSAPPTSSPSGYTSTNLSTRPHLQIRRDLLQIKPSTITSTSGIGNSNLSTHNPPDVLPPPPPLILTSYNRRRIGSPGPSRVLLELQEREREREREMERECEREREREFEHEREEETRLVRAPTPQPLPPPPPRSVPTRHGFTIADIMRR